MNTRVYPGIPGFASVFFQVNRCAANLFVEASGIVSDPSTASSRTLEVFTAFLRLGCTSFGGPIAHIGYFREAFVQRRRWLTEADFADLVALSHVLPGPSSSQVGMAIGLQRAGLGGMLAAWIAFTLPSAVLMIAFAYGSNAVGLGAQVMVGLKAVAVAVVAHAVIGMARSLGSGLRWLLLASLALTASLLLPGPATQILVIVAAGVLGWRLLPRPELTHGSGAFSVRVPKLVASLAAGVFVALLLGLPLAAKASNAELVSLADGLFRAGALVFGGGHAVLPLLETQTVAPGLLSAEEFLAGYGAAQALPGPLFAFGAYLGFVASAPTGLVGAAIATVAIFAPSMLMLLAVLPMWEQLRQSFALRHVVSGVNAGVVGLLAAAFVNPAATQGLTSWGAGAIALAAFVAMQWSRAPIWLVVILAAVVGGVVG